MDELCLKKLWADAGGILDVELFVISMLLLVANDCIVVNMSDACCSNLIGYH